MRVRSGPRISRQHHAGANHRGHFPTSHRKSPRGILLHDHHDWLDTEPSDFHSPPPSHRTSSTPFIVSHAAIKKVSTFNTGIGARSSSLRMGPTMIETILPTLCQATILATTNMIVTTIRVITTTYTRPLTKKFHRGPQE